MIKFIPKCLIIFDDIVTRIISLLSFFEYSSLEWRSTDGLCFCIPAPSLRCLSALMVICRFLSVFYGQDTVSCEQRMFDLFLFNLDAFCFPGLRTQAGTFRRKLTRSGRCEHRCRVPGWSYGEASTRSPDTMLAVDFFCRCSLSSWRRSLLVLRVLSAFVVIRLGLPLSDALSGRG